MTGTADESTQKTIYQQLTMNKTMVKLFVSPNRENLKFKVAKVKKDETIAQLTWLVNELKEKGPLTPQTLIFCCTVRDIATIVNWFLVKLDNAAFSPRTSRKREDCLIGIYHSLTVESNKERLTKGLKEDGVPRVVLATTALSMGVNFPHIRRVIMYGTPRSILDFHQEAGRAGRDGLPSEVTLYYHGQQAAHCEEEVKDFLRMPGCIRVAAYASLDANITPMQPAHDCCSTCALQCNCGRSECRITTSETELTEVAMKVREVSQDDKQLLHSALLELKGSITSNTIMAFGDCHGFSSQLVGEIIENCDKLFSLVDVLKFVPVFSAKHAMMIYEVLNDVFNDCEDISCGDTGETVSSQTTSYDMEYLLGSEYDNEGEPCDLDIL